jgi:hypothetical protein
MPFLLFGGTFSFQFLASGLKMKMLVLFVHLFNSELVIARDSPRSWPLAYRLATVALLLGLSGFIGCHKLANRLAKTDDSLR